MPFVPMRDGQRLHVRVVGRGRPVLLLPGLGMQGAHWLPFVAPFLATHRFHLPDFRGFGRSSHLRIERADVFESHALDVRDVVAHFGLRDALLGGISLGCTTALHMLRAGGLDFASAYLHIDQSPCVGNREGWRHGLVGERQEETFATMRDALAVLDRYPTATHVLDLPRHERPFVVDTLSRIAAMIAGDERRARRVARAITLPRFLSGRLPLAHLDDVRTYLRAYTAGGHDYRDALPELRVPVTLMVGMQSPLYAPEGQLEIARRAPKVRVVRFENSGHVPLVDEPAKFVREFGRFLRDPHHRA